MYNTREVLSWTEEGFFYVSILKFDPLQVERILIFYYTEKTAFDGPLLLSCLLGEFKISTFEHRAAF